MKSLVLFLNSHPKVVFSVFFKRKKTMTSPYHPNPSLASPLSLHSPEVTPEAQFCPAPLGGLGGGELPATLAQEGEEDFMVLPGFSKYKQGTRSFGS